MPAELTATEGGAGSVESSASRPNAGATRLDSRLALTAIVLLAFVAYAGAVQLVETPRIFYDELLYMEAADSLAAGEGLEVRGAPYERGVLFPAAVAPLLWAAPDRAVGYRLVKLLNALFFALAAIPVYLLARRLLAPRPSLGVAALAVAIPSSVYVSVVMTESLAYLTSCWALLVVVLAVERPTAVRQGAAILAIGIAFLARAQLGVIFVAFALSLLLAIWLVPERRDRLPASLARLWPTGLVLAAGAGFALAGALSGGDSTSSSLGYGDSVVAFPDLTDAGSWLVHHAANLGVYLALVPVALAPIVLSAWLVRARAGSVRDAGMLAVLVTTTIGFLALAALVIANADPALEIDRLHDRYLFYVLPLWLIVLVAWVTEGAPIPRRAALAGAAGALVLALALPYGELEVADGVKLFSAVGTAFPAAVVEIAGSPGAGRIAMLVLAAMLVAGVLLRSGKGAGLALGAVIVVFALDGVLVWAKAFNPPEKAVFAGSLERRWVDENVGDGSVAVLSTPCEGGELARDSLSLTEFFNSSIERVVDIGGDFPTGRVDARGGIRDARGPLAAEYAVAQPGVVLVGDRIAEGTNARLVLWQVGGRVRVAGATSDADVTRAACG